MKIKKEFIGSVIRATAKNGTTHDLLIEDSKECIKMAKILKLDIFEKDATNKKSSKPKHNSDANGENDDK